MAAVEQRSRPGDATHDLYSRYGKQIYAYCLHKLRSKEEAEDAVQTTFMNAFRSLQRGTQTQFEQAWLFRIAHNVCVARAMSSSRRLRLESPNDFEVLQEVVPAREGDGDSLELLGIEEALELMPENQRRAILLREWQGLSYREISEELGLSQSAIEMLIFRARRSLAGALEQPGETRAKHARRAGSIVAGLLGALKTPLGGGAVIKAVTIAAAAVAVVGESAQHTIVHRQLQQHQPARTAAPAPVAAVEPHTMFVTKQAATTAPKRRAARKTPVAPVHVVRAAHTSPTPLARTDDPASEPVPARQPVGAVTPAPAPAERPGAVEAPSTPAEPPPVAAPAPATDEPAPVPATPAPTPSDGIGNAYGHDKEHGKPGDSPPAPAAAPAADEATPAAAGNASGHDGPRGGNPTKP